MHFNKIQLLAIALIFTSCESWFEPQPASNPEAVFENLWNTFQEEYAPFEERGVDWEAMYAQYRPQVSAQTTDAELFLILSQMLGSLDDGHVSLTAPGRDVYFSNRIRRELIDDELFDLVVVKSYLENDFQEGGENSFVFGKLKNVNLAYIYFDHVSENFFELNTFLEKYASANGFIIDLRHNQGGDFTYCFSEIGRLTNEKRYVFRSKTKNGPGPTDYTSWKEWHIEPAGSYVDQPIVVLADRYTISAGERALMAFSVLPQVTVMGDTTNGAHGTMIGRELPNGWFYALVPQKVELPDGRSYEGIGLAPDVFVKNTLDEMSAGTDRTLELAIQHLQ